MVIYIVGFLITLLFLWLLQNKAKTKKTKIILMILAVLPLFTISILRYDVGTDYLKRYVTDYFDIAQGRDIPNLEIGFQLIDRVCLMFTQEPYLLFIVTSAIILGIFFGTVYKESKNILLSIAIFFLGRFFLWFIKLNKTIYCDWNFINRI